MSARSAAARPFLRAAIVAVGSELLTPARVDTNSLLITRRLNELGIDVRGKCVAGDDRDDIAIAFRRALDRVDLVVMTGGLGPTDDDLTREAVAEALGLPLEEDPALVEAIERRFRARGLRMPDANRRQAMVPRGARVLENPHGTAPGLWLEVEGRGVALLPGPPRELEPMLEALARGPIGARAPGRPVIRRVLRIAGRTESHVEEAVQPVYSRWKTQAVPIETTILAAPGTIELHLSARAAVDTAGPALDAAAREIEAVLGPDLYSTDGRQMEEVVGDLLRGRRLTLAIGESCTGGLVASRVTDVPGSSGYFQLGVVCYSNRAKVDLLGVEPALLETHGAVSEPVALAMAQGARQRGRADLGVAVTGIAGPGGGTAAKPVGTVAIAVAGPGDATSVRTYRFPGGRQQVKVQASQAAFDLVRRALVERREDGAPAPPTAG